MIKSNNSIKSITFTYLISLLPLILYGFYKNGISLYIKGYVNVFGMLKPLLFILLGGLIGIIVNIIYEKIIKKSNKDLISIIFSSFHLLYGLLIASVSSINTNIFLFSIVTFGILFISKFKDFKFNVVALASLIMFFIMNILGEFSFLNIYEASSNFNMNAIDYLFGKGSGGIFTTNILLLVVGFIILCSNNMYKRSIPVLATTVFTILSVIYSILTNNITNILNMLFTNGILFSFVFIASDMISSSYTKQGQVIYGILVGILTFILYLINPTLSSFGGIFIVSIINSLIDLKFE